jgi:hypothetical protein
MKGSALTPISRRRYWVTYRRTHRMALVACLALMAVVRPSLGQEQEFFRIAAGEGGFQPSLGDGAEFGASIVVLGDVNGDGVEDLAVGSPGDDTSGPDAGAIWVLLMTEDGRVQSWAKTTGLPGTGMGRYLAPLGDLDGDGCSDLATLVNGRLRFVDICDDGTPRIRMYWRPLGSPTTTFERLGASTMVTEEGVSIAIGGANSVQVWRVEADYSVIFVWGRGVENLLAMDCSVSDLNRDGVGDLVCSQRRQPGIGLPTALVMYLGNTAGGIGESSIVLDLQELTALKFPVTSPGNDLFRFIGPVIVPRWREGGSLTSLVVGAKSVSGLRGALIRIVLSPTLDAISVEDLGDAIPGFYDSLRSGELFGTAVAKADLDDNGLEEIFVGAPARAVFGNEEAGGAVWVFRNVPPPAPFVWRTEAPVAPTIDGDARVVSRIFDMHGIVEAQLEFRRGGDRSFFSAEMTALDDTTFAYDVPGWIVGTRGIEFAVTATSASGLETREPEVGSASLQVRLPQGVTLPMASGTKPSDYRLVTFPIELDATDAAAVLEDDLGSYDVKRWRFFNWAATAKGGTSGWGPHGPQSPGTLIEYGARPITIRPGASYWLLTKDPDPAIDSGPGLTVPTSEPFERILQYGWHFIANPFMFDLPLGQVASAGSTPRILPELLDQGLFDLISWDGTEFVEVSDTLKAFEGYALFTQDCLDVYQCDVNTSGALHFYADPARIPQASAKEVSTRVTEAWSIGIEAVQGTAHDRFNFASVAPGASEGWDRMDRPEPPVIGDYVSVSFSHPEWGRLATSYRRDTRPEPTKGDVWPIEVRTRTFDPVELRFEGLASIPSRFHVWLVDERAGIRKDLREASIYTLAGPGEQYPAKLSLVVGTEEYLADSYAEIRPVPESANLLPIYPNPFTGSATIRYRLPEAARANIDVVDVLGRLVRTLRAPSDVSAGSHVVVWDGRGQHGTPVAAGLYFVRLHTSENVLTQVVTLLR